MRNKAYAEQQRPSNTESQDPKLEVLKVSFQEIEDRASTKTEVLTEILEHDTEILHITHWGINE